MSYTGRSCIEDGTTFERNTKLDSCGGMLLMQHTNTILERLYTDVRNLRRSNVFTFFLLSHIRS